MSTMTTPNNIRFPLEPVPMLENKRGGEFGSLKSLEEFDREQKIKHFGEYARCDDNCGCCITL